MSRPLTSPKNPVLLLGQYELTPELHRIGLKVLDELSQKERNERDSAQNMQTDTIKSVQAQLDRLLDMATQDFISGDEYKQKSQNLRKRLKELQEQQTMVAERAANWYEIVGNTLNFLENANEEFVNGDLLAKRRILSAIGEHPTLIELYHYPNCQGTITEITNAYKRKRQ